MVLVLARVLSRVHRRIAASRQADEERKKNWSLPAATPPRGLNGSPSSRLERQACAPFAPFTAPVPASGVPPPRHPHGTPPSFRVP